jgi:hypothetical protein
MLMSCEERVPLPFRVLALVPALFASVDRRVSSFWMERVTVVVIPSWVYEVRSPLGSYDQAWLEPFG